MDNPATPSGSTRAGMAGGTLLTVLLQINGADFLKTVVLTATGAMVSFLVSAALQRLLRKRRR